MHMRTDELRAEFASSAPEDEFSVGATLAGLYRVECPAIKGGMGVVYRVHHNEWNVDLAMKRPYSRLFTSDLSHTQFIEECNAWIKLGIHPNIVVCYYVREIEKIPSIFSEWMDGGSLRQWIGRSIPNPSGGEDIFADRARRPLAKDRIMADNLDPVRRAPDLIIGSWCGKHFRPERVTARPGWAEVPAVRTGQIHEIKSAIILTPGVVAIREGLPILSRLFQDWAAPRA